MDTTLRRSLTIQRDTPLTTKELDDEFREIYFSGGVGIKLFLHPDSILELTQLAKKSQSVIRLRIHPTDTPGGIFCTMVTGYLHPVTGETIYIEPDLFMRQHDFKIQYTDSLPLNGTGTETTLTNRRRITDE